MVPKKVLPAIAELLDIPGYSGTSEDVSTAVHCEQKVAARVLMDLLINRNIYIAGWTEAHGNRVPVYAKRTAGQNDACVPRLKRKAASKKSLPKVARIGMWGL